jgi:hypothetical protein
MQRALRIGRPVLIVLAVVGTLAALVYGFCSLGALQAASAHPDPASGRVFPYEQTHRDGTPHTVYVSRTFDLASRISGWIAGIFWGVTGAVLLLFLLGDSARLLLPNHMKFANVELARYRETAGPDGVTADGLRYVDGWRDYRRRTSLGSAWLLGGLVFLVLWLPTEDDRLLRTVVPIVWIIGCVVAIGAMRTFRCPRCSERFSPSGWRATAPTFCTHCGLPAHSMKPDEVSPHFAEWRQQNDRKRR